MSNENILIAKFKEGDITTYAYGQWQHNWGQILQIEGLDLQTGTQVHFSLSETGGEAVPMVAVREGDVLKVEVPGQLLQNEDALADFNIYAYVYTSNDNSGQTIRKIIIPVEARPDIGTETPKYIPHPLDLMMQQVKQEIEEATKDKVYIAKYGITTFEEIKTAIDSGKEVILVDEQKTEKRTLTEAGVYDSNYNFYRSVENYNFASNIMPPNSLAANLPSGEEFVIVVPEGVTSIGNYSLFGYNGDFKTIVLPEGLKTIGSRALDSNTMETLIIPNSVTSISNDALSSSVKTIYYSGSATGFPWGATNATLLPNDGAEYDFGRVEGYRNVYELSSSTDYTHSFLCVYENMLITKTCDKDNNWSEDEIPLDSVRTVTSPNIVYGTDDHGEQIAIPWADYNATPYTIVRRDSSGHVSVANPQASNHAVNKGFADLNYIVRNTSKLPTFANEEALYGTHYDPYGNPTPGTFYISTTPVQGRVVRYGDDGTLETNTPTTDLDCANKKYVDGLVGNSSGIFIATYGETTYDQVLSAYLNNKGITLKVPGTQVGNGLMNLSMTLARVDNNNNNSTDRYTFTFSTDENGVSHYASINYDTQAWNYWNYNYAMGVNNHENAIVSLINESADLRKATTVYKREEIPANGRFQLREKGFYIFGGSDYDLNFCDASGNTIGKTDALVVIVFCTELKSDGTFDVYVMQNYKATLGVPSMDGMPYGNITRNHYIHNTNSSKGAYVYYMRPSEV